MSDRESSRTPAKPVTTRTRVGRRALFGAALLAAGGVGAGATAIAQHRHAPMLVALAPAPIATMREWSRVAVKGEVADVFGNKFVLADDSGRALIETGRKGESGALVSKQETVTVQGRFEHGFVHAVAIQYGDGRTVLLDPMGGPPPPPPPRGPLS